jgi:5-methylcytosine-specific restriction protein A
VRDEIQRWVSTYPKQPGWRDGSFAAAAEADIVKHEVPDAIRAALPNLGAVEVKGSAGKGGWTDTPWVALLDPAVTTTTQEGYYVVYLLSLGCERLYLTLAQGCTELKERAGIPSARQELQRRASQMLSRLGGRPTNLGPLPVRLGTTSWRGQLYEPGVVVSAEYSTANLPSEIVLVRDLEEALSLYRHLRVSGGWTPDDEIMIEAREERGSKTLEQAKRYRQHRTIERQPGHAREVKKRQGTICKGCDKDMLDVYGEIAQGLIDAHHLTPLSSLEEGEVAHFDPMDDFAVLCPNCHRVIHRMEDPSDLGALRQLLIPRTTPTISSAGGSSD